MCFRPADAAAPPVVCPNCGKEVTASRGIIPKKCPFCREPLPQDGAAEVVGSVSAAPKAPAPANPAAPKVPGAPTPRAQ